VSSRTEDPDAAGDRAPTGVLSAPGNLRHYGGAAALLALIGFLVFRRYLLLEHLYLFKDIGSDTINYYWPNLVNTAEYLRAHGLPTWSFHQGMGQNILPFSVGDPFNWILYALGAKNLAYGIVWVELLKVVAAGLLFLAFLRTVGLTRYCSVVGAVLYAFSGFMILGSGWYDFSSEAVFFALLLWAFERYHRDGDGRLLPVAVCLVGAYSPFNWYLYGVILLAWSLLRGLGGDGGSLRSWLRLMGGLILWSSLGVGLSACLSVSALAEMANSPRVGGDSGFFDALAGTSIFTPEAKGHYMTSVLRTFSSDLLGSGSDYHGGDNYLEAPMFYGGTLSLLLCSQVFVHASRRGRIACGLFALAFVIPILFPFFRYAFWLFAGDYYRGFSVFVILGLVFFAVQSLDRLVRGAKPNLYVLGGTLGLLLLGLYYPYVYRASIDSSLRLVVTGLLVLEAGLVWAAVRRSRIGALARIGLVLLVCGEAAYFSGVTVNRREVVSAEEYERKTGYNDYTVDAVRFLEERDPGFFRMDKDYRSGPSEHRSFNDAKVQRYFGTASYHSFNHGGYVAFLRGMEIVEPGVEEQNRWARGLRANPLLQIWASHKYLLSKSGGPRFLPCFRPIERFEDVEVYENEHFLPLGFTYDAVLPRSELRSLGAVHKNIALMRAAVIEDSNREVLEAFPKLDRRSLPRAYPVAAIAEDVERRGRDAFRMTEFEEKRIAGELSLDARKILFFTIPFDRGWTAVVNGEVRDLVPVNIGFTGLVLEPGDYEITLRYSPPFFVASVCVSLFCLVAYALLAVVFRRRESRPPAVAA